MLNPPQSLKELVAYLTEHRRVRMTMRGQAEIRRFSSFANGGLWWAGDAPGLDSYTPLGCSGTGSKTAVTFRGDGFTVEKFGIPIVFDYLPDDPAIGGQ